MATVADLSLASSPSVRTRLAEHRELVKSLMKFSLLEFDDDDDSYEDEEFRAMAASVLERLHQLSPDMPVMLDALWQELLPAGSLSATSLSAHLLLVRSKSAHLDSSLPSLVAWIPPVVAYAD